MECSSPKFLRSRAKELVVIGQFQMAATKAVITKGKTLKQGTHHKLGFEFFAKTKLGTLSGTGTADFTDNEMNVWLKYNLPENEVPEYQYICKREEETVDGLSLLDGMNTVMKSLDQSAKKP